MSKLTRPLESATRKEIDLILSNLGWNIDESSKDCNVFTERAKTAEQNDKLRGNNPDYVLYKSGTDEPIAIVEAKRKGQGIEQAIDDAVIKYANPLKTKIVFAYDGAFFKSWHTDTKKELLTDGTAITQLVTEKKLLRFVQEGYSISEISPTVKHSRAELISIFKWANDLLRKEGLRQGIERFTEFANLIFLKLISELEHERERNNEPRILDVQYSWEAFASMSQVPMMNYINDTVLPKLVSEYNHSGEVFQSKLLIKNPKTLKAIVDKLSSISLTDADSDVKGDAFEYFIKDSVAVGNDLGEYFTPRHIVDFMIELIEPKFGETVYDPTCGTGGFLISAFRYIKRRCANTPENIAKLKGHTVYGRELTNTAKIAKMNMILTGDGHTNIVQTDSLANPVTEEYSVALANPPYGQATDYGGYYPIPSNDGDAVFIQHIYKSLTKDGRAAVIVPEGLLFKGGDMLKVREYLLKNCSVDGIISLPQGVFRPYANNKTNIIVFHKDKKGTKSIWFYNMTADGFDLKSDLRRPVDDNDIPDLLSKWTDRRETNKSWIANIDTIRASNYDLLAKTYQPRETVQKEGFVRFSTFLTPSTEKTVVKDDELYEQITVRWYGKGAKLRRQIKGKKIDTKNQHIAKAGDVIISKIDANVGALAVVPTELDGAIASSDFPLFKVDKTKINIDYLDHCLRYGNYANFLADYAKGTTKRQRVKVSDILDLTIFVPDKEEQQQIVQRIKKQEEIIRNTEQTILAIKEGLVDKSDFDGDWQYEDLANLCDEIKTGGTPSRANPAYFKGNIPWVKISDLKELNYVCETEEKITEEAIRNSNAKKLPKGTVLISIFASIGTVSILGIEACTNQAIAALMPKKSKILGEYLLYFLHTLKPHYAQKARGIAQKNINLDIMKAVKVPVPPLEVQDLIVKKINTRKIAISELEKAKERSLEVIQGIAKNKCGIDHSRSLVKIPKISDFLKDN